ncbi:MAG: VOC family protein [Cyclobacteriaceae bacterium]
MKIEHVAVWTSRPEILRDFYCRFFRGVSNDRYHNPSKDFSSYFISFGHGARLEIMSRPDIPDNLNNPDNQYKGLIHFAFEVETMEEVDRLAYKFTEAGFPLLSGPRKTGDGYYEFEIFDPDRNRVEVGTIYRAD